jgi:hypothetical protein
MAVFALLNIAVILYLIVGSIQRKRLYNMALLKHRGGTIKTWDADGKQTESFIYGPGLHKPCGDCGAKANKGCITSTGRALGKVHKSRMS